MKHRLILFAILLAALCLPAAAQTLNDCSAAEIYFTGDHWFAPIVIAPSLAPPSAAVTKADLAELHKIQAARTPATVAVALADSNELSMAIYASFLPINKEKMPRTFALSLHLCQEAAQIASSIKHVYNRPRPYEEDTTLTPVCFSDVKIIGSSYPSGHTITGYLEGLALSDLLGGARNKILKRAAEFAHNREVCGVHHPTDVAAGRLVAERLYLKLKTNPIFQEEFKQAKQELEAQITK